ncbi:Uncharacterised protein [Mycobacteroides abscessus]|nr:Uncharacterised protein [Mycobacteroides abscessus]
MKDNAALGCSIKFGKCHPGDVYHVSEHPSLRQPVLSDGRVQYQQHLVDICAAFHDALDLAELVHEAGLGVQSTGGVDDHHVGALPDTGIDGVEGDRGGVGTLGAPNHLRTDALPPGLELIGGGGTERVRRAQYHPAPVGDKHTRQLADRGGLAGAVHTDDEQHRRFVVVRQRLDRSVKLGLQFVDQYLAQQRPGLRLGAHAARCHLTAQPVHDRGGNRGAEVGDQQGVLDLFPRFLVQVAGAQQPEQTPTHRVLRTGQTSPQPVEPSGNRRDVIEYGLRLRGRLGFGFRLRRGLGHSLTGHGRLRRLSRLRDLNGLRFRSGLGQLDVRDGAPRRVAWNFGVITHGGQRGRLRASLAEGDGGTGGVSAGSVGRCGALGDPRVFVRTCQADTTGAVTHQSEDQCGNNHDGNDRNGDPHFKRHQGIVTGTQEAPH